MGRWGQVTHFLRVNEFLADVIANKETLPVYGDLVDRIKVFKTVPIIEESVVSLSF